MFISKKDIELLKSRFITLEGNPYNPMGFSILTQSLGDFNENTGLYEFILTKNSLN